MKSLNPACKLIGLVVPTLLLAGLHHPAVNLAVFAVCLAALLLSRANVKVLSGALLPVLLVAVGMFSTGYHFHAGAGMPINAAAQALTALTESCRIFRSAARAAGAMVFCRKAPGRELISPRAGRRSPPRTALPCRRIFSGGWRRPPVNPGRSPPSCSRIPAAALIWR